jgi:hypothetical protein
MTWLKYLSTCAMLLAVGAAKKNMLMSEMIHWVNHLRGRYPAGPVRNLISVSRSRTTSIKASVNKFTTNFCVSVGRAGYSAEPIEQTFEKIIFTFLKERRSDWRWRQPGIRSGF